MQGRTCDTCGERDSGTRALLLACCTCALIRHHTCGPISLRPSIKHLNAYRSARTLAMSNSGGELAGGVIPEWICLECVPPGQGRRRLWTSREGRGASVSTVGIGRQGSASGSRSSVAPSGSRAGTVSPSLFLAFNHNDGKSAIKQLRTPTPTPTKPPPIDTPSPPPTNHTPSPSTSTPPPPPTMNTPPPPVDTPSPPTTNPYSESENSPTRVELGMRGGWRKRKSVEVGMEMLSGVELSSPLKRRKADEGSGWMLGARNNGPMVGGSEGTGHPGSSSRVRITPGINPISVAPRTGSLSYQRNHPPRSDLNIFTPTSTASPDPTHPTFLTDQRKGLPRFRERKAQRRYDLDDLDDDDEDEMDVDQDDDTGVDGAVAKEPESEASSKGSRGRGEGRVASAIATMGYRLPAIPDVERGKGRDLISGETAVKKPQPRQMLGGVTAAAAEGSSDAGQGSSGLLKPDQPMLLGDRHPEAALDALSSANSQCPLGPGLDTAAERDHVSERQASAFGETPDQPMVSQHSPSDQFFPMGSAIKPISLSDDKEDGAYANANVDTDIDMDHESSITSSQPDQLVKGYVRPRIPPGSKGRAISVSSEEDELKEDEKRAVDENPTPKQTPLVVENIEVTARSPDPSWHALLPSCLRETGFVIPKTITLAKGSALEDGLSETRAWEEDWHKTQRTGEAYDQRMEKLWNDPTSDQTYVPLWRTRMEALSSRVVKRPKGEKKRKSQAGKREIGLEQGLEVDFRDVRI